MTAFTVDDALRMITEAADRIEQDAATADWGCGLLLSEVIVLREVHNDIALARLTANA